TRQNLQFNWIKLADTPDILAKLATVEMHAIQTSGNCIRNISADQYAGAAADEVADPRPWAELIRQWSTFHPEFSYLPRKFKIAVIAADEDRAAMRLHDIGIQLLERDGELGGAIYVGGGMGRTPMISHLIRDFVTADDLMSYLEAALRVYNRYGRRDNIYKARIKILLHEIGPDEYRRQVEEEFLAVKQLGLDPPRAELERITAMFAPPAFAPDAAAELDRSDPDFAVWLDQNVVAHKQAGYAIVNISLKPAGGIPGDASADQIDLMADLGARYSFDELRVTHAQNIVLPHVAIRDLKAVWSALAEAGLAEANLDLITDIIACPGLDYCSLANARSIPLAQKIAARFADRDRQRDLGELKLKISGCINACGHHHAGHIGILGVDKKGTENYQLSLGGSGAEDVSLAKITGPGFSEDGVVDAIERVTDTYVAVRTKGERFLDTYRRVGFEPFKEAIYG
ncbi:nitrite/sulfite reductase, partial [Sphingomonas sp.]|uniref:nitrite/sulfite reductase n=3 Tax=unclassified Sphingomonas TaxID=196159 RepID=UPI0025E4DD0F